MRNDASASTISSFVAEGTDGSSGGHTACEQSALTSSLIDMVPESSWYSTRQVSQGMRATLQLVIPGSCAIT